MLRNRRGGGVSDIAIEMAYMALMREDWRFFPELFAVSRRTIGVVHLNLSVTAAYNLVGLSLAAAGLLSLPRHSRRSNYRNGFCRERPRLRLKSRLGLTESHKSRCFLLMLLIEAPSTIPTTPGIQ